MVDWNSLESILRGMRSRNEQGALELTNWIADNKTPDKGLGAIKRNRELAADYPQRTTLADGSPVTPDHRELKPNGQQKDYVVLSAEERSKGFVRPVRRSYRHVGVITPPANLRDLTPEEATQYAQFNYAKFEEYPPARSPLVGKFWTQKELNTLSGCNTVTTMSAAIAETFARDPGFYSGTFCIGCGTHLPLDQFVWEGTTERVGT